jgi:integrase
VRAGVTGLTFHDLRGSAVVRLALAEATVPQIATFTGHSLKDVEAILDAIISVVTFSSLKRRS